MTRFRELVDWLHFSGFLRWAIIALLVLKAILVFARTTGGQTDTSKVMATSASSSHEFGILFGFLGVLFALFFWLIGVLLWLKAKQKQRPHTPRAMGTTSACSERRVFE
jgi:predicted membrane protein